MLWPCAQLHYLFVVNDINVSQGGVATYARCGGMFNIHLTANLLRNHPVKKIVNRLRFEIIMDIESVSGPVFDPLCILGPM